MGMELVIADVIARHSETAADAEIGIGRSVAAICLDAGIAIREKRVADAPGIDDICAGPKRLNNAGSDQPGIAESNRPRDVVVSRAAGGKQVVRRELVRRRVIQSIAYKPAEYGVAGGPLEIHPAHQLPFVRYVHESVRDLTAIVRCRRFRKNAIQHVDCRLAVQRGINTIVRKRRLQRDRPACITCTRSKSGPIARHHCGRWNE